MKLDGSSQRIGEAIDELSGAIAGEVRADRLSRALYSTDASIYQIVPDAVILPRSVEDVAAAVRVCGKHDLPLTARGAGTGLAGGAVNRGLILDCSRFFNRVLSIDPQSRTAVVEPGVVLDELNAKLKPHGLQFAPDVATSSRATIGGMIANNSCGARSIIHGRTVDHIVNLTAVLSDGSAWTWGRGCPRRAAPDPRDNSLAQRCDETLAAVARGYGDEISARFPKILRSNGGYGLDRLRIENGRVNSEAVICGSEGTLCVVVRATLNLVPPPNRKGLVVVHFKDLLAALEATPPALEHQPAAVELVDRPILDAAKISPAMANRRGFIDGDPEAILIVEIYDERQDRLNERLQAVAADLKARRLGYAWPVLTEAAPQADVWAVRKSGLGLAMSRPGSWQPHAFVEDTAVEPRRLRDYVARLQAIMREEGIDRAGYYAHASVGCLHIRPVLNLKLRSDVERMRRIAERVSSLVLEFGGTMTGEHGDGIVRSGWMEKMYGPRIVEAFRKVKDAFDPNNLFNPGKIVSPPPMTDNLRFALEPASASADNVASAPCGRRGAASPPADVAARALARPEEGGGSCRAVASPPATFVASAPRGRRQAPEPRASPANDTYLDFSAYNGMAGLAEMCSGVGECRQRLVGTMCPSYMATGEEKHSTRGRANALRIALAEGGLLHGLSDPAINEVLDLCLSCKACKSECPTGVDMARLKAEWLADRHRRKGVPRRSRLIADLPELAIWGCRLAPISNWLVRSRLLRAVMEKLYGLDRRVPPPSFARQTFRRWFAKRRFLKSVAPPSPWRGHRRDACATGRVVYFVDTWTNYYTPQVGRAAVKVLEALGCEVVVPPTRCCGRPAISKGLLGKARRLAEANVAVLGPYAARGVPIVGTEPSCVSALMDEYPQLLRTDQARLVASAVVTIEAFVAGVLRERPDALRLGNGPGLLYHGHCHQKALVGTAAAMQVLGKLSGGNTVEIDSGCCGMAGSFGHEVEHYEVARAIGEQRLFPAVRGRGDARIAVSGFSCRQHIEHHAGAEPRHVIEYLAEAIT